MHNNRSRKRASLLLVFWLAGVSACATSTVNPWDGLTAETEKAVTPLDCGKFPLPSEVDGDVLVYSDANALEAYRTCSEANQGIATEHAAQIDQLKIARKSLIEAGQSQRRIADMRQEMLDDERRRNLYEKFGLYAVIIGMGFAL